MTLSGCVLFLKGYRYFHISHYVFLHIPTMCLIPLCARTYLATWPFQWSKHTLLSNVVARTQPSSWHWGRRRLRPSRRCLRLMRNNFVASATKVTLAGWAIAGA